MSVKRKCLVSLSFSNTIQIVQVHTHTTVRTQMDLRCERRRFHKRKQGNNQVRIEKIVNI